MTTRQVYVGVLLALLTMVALKLLAVIVLGLLSF